MVLPSRHEIRAIDISVLISAGIHEIPVIKRPVVGIIPTGDEMIDYRETPEDGRIIETNSWMFQNLVTENHGVGRRYPIIKDDPVKIRSVEMCIRDRL